MPSMHVGSFRNLRQKKITKLEALREAQQWMISASRKAVREDASPTYTLLNKGQSIELVGIARCLDLMPMGFVALAPQRIGGKNRNNTKVAE